MRILVDFDNTIAKSAETIIKLYQKKTGDYYKRYNDKDLQWDFSPYISTTDDLKWALGMFGRQEFYDALEPFKCVLEVLERLSSKHEIIIVTKKHPDAVSMNAQWIRNNLSFVHRVVYLDQDSFDKSLVVGDVIIDDKINALGGDRNLRLLIGDYGYQEKEFAEFAKLNNYYYKYGFNIESVIRVNDWLEIETIINNF